MTRIGLLIFVLALLSEATIEPGWLTEMRYCDLVARGTVQSVEVSLEPRLEAMPMIPGGKRGEFVEITKVRLNAVNVLRGLSPRDSLDFVVLGTSAYRKNYETGQEIVVRLIWGEPVLAGSYWLFSDEGRFLRQKSDWVCQSGGAVVKDATEIGRRLGAVAPRQVLVESEFAVTGVIANVRVETVYDGKGKDAVQMSLTLANVESLGGTELPREIAVRQILSGSYWPTWRDSAPPCARFRRRVTGIACSSNASIMASPSSMGSTVSTMYREKSGHVQSLV